jgi:hypothetical protein
MTVVLKNIVGVGLGVGFTTQPYLATRRDLCIIGVTVAGAAVGCVPMCPEKVALAARIYQRPVLDRSMFAIRPVIGDGERQLPATAAGRHLDPDRRRSTHQQTTTLQTGSPALTIRRMSTPILEEALATPYIGDLAVVSRAAAPRLPCSNRRTR